MAGSPEAVLLDEARRGISRQEANLDTLHIKAVAVLSSAAVVAGLMGASIPAGRFGRWAIAAIVAFALTGIHTVVIVWPVKMKFSGQLEPLLTHIDDELANLDDAGRSVAAMQYERQLAADLDRYRIANMKPIEEKTKLFTCACALLGLQVVLWAIARLIA